MIDPLDVPLPLTSYPYAQGYAQLSDVQARINAGTWNPSDRTSSLSASQVNAWLRDASARIDSALAARGYYVPLQADPNWVPGNMPTFNGIGVPAWSLLRSLAATYAASLVERTRHGAVGTGDDPNASDWMAIFEAGLARLAGDPKSGQVADNLTAFGVDGTFAPEIDPSKGISSGSMGMVYADEYQGPFFSRGQNLGSGWEQVTPTVNPSNQRGSDALTLPDLDGDDG